MAVFANACKQDSPRTPGTCSRVVLVFGKLSSFEGSSANPAIVYSPIGIPCCETIAQLLRRSVFLFSLSTDSERRITTVPIDYCRCPRLGGVLKVSFCSVSYCNSHRGTNRVYRSHVGLVSWIMAQLGSNNTSLAVKRLRVRVSELVSNSIRVSHYDASRRGFGRPRQKDTVLCGQRGN